MVLCSPEIGACPSSVGALHLNYSPAGQYITIKFFTGTEGEVEMGFFDARFGTYLAVAALLIMTPGPDTALVTRYALLAGKRAAFFTTLGIGMGSIIWALASVLGVAALLEGSAVAFTIWKL